MKPDFEGAKQYALERLARELSPKLCYHSMEHTRDEVLPATERLAVLEGIDGEGLVLLQTAALFHDIGFVKQREEHERVGVEIATEALPIFNYSESQLKAINGMIMATRLPQTPTTLLESIVADADLDLLGREAFWIRHQDLRQELANYGEVLTSDEWYRRQMAFLRDHRYFTVAAQDLRGPRKRENLVKLMDLLGYQRIQ